MTYLIQTSEAHSASIHPLLHADEIGYVHSIFQNGWNIRMGDGLIFIGGMKNGQLPFGIHLDDEQVPQLIALLHKGDAVLYDRVMSSLFFSSFCIKLDRPRAYDSTIGLAEVQPEALLSSLGVFASEIGAYHRLTGTGIQVDHFTECILSRSYASCSDHEHKAIQLMNSVQMQSLSLIDETLRYWMGRGNGLTPSGDDMLTGMLAVDAIIVICSDRFQLHLSELIEREALTTDISREYLRYALKGQFSSVVSNVLHALVLGDTGNLMKRTRELLSVGHSSGLDTAFGILLGMLTIGRNPIWHKKS